MLGFGLAIPCHRGLNSLNTSGPFGIYCSVDQPGLSRREFGRTALRIFTAIGLFSSMRGRAAVARPEGVNRPDLLPPEFTSVIDLENFLARGDERRMREQLTDLEARTGFKVRVLTQRFPVTPGLAIRDYWRVDDKTVVLVADYFSGGGSFLHFTVGPDVDALLPPRFWSLLSSSLGNRFYVSKHGEDAAILGAVDAIRMCLLQDGCKVPPQDDSYFLR